MCTLADQSAPEPGRDPSVAARVEQLYESHAPLVRSVCRSLLRDRVEAEDAMQQTFLSAQRALLNGSSPLDPAAWLATIARHESLARVRARMREPLPLEIDEHEAALDAHAAAVRREETGELRDALAELPQQQREAILLREMRGASYQEVAAALSVTTSAVESLLFRARRSLQARLREALAALTPGGLVQPLQDLAARVAGGGIAAPAAAKVAAVGLGGAVATGGALVGPTVLGLGHAPVSPSAVSRPAVNHVAHGKPAEPRVTFTLDSTSRPAPSATATRPHHVERSDARQAEAPTNETSGPETADRSSTSGSDRGSSEDGSTRQPATVSSGDSGTGTTDDSTTSPSETTTAPSGSTTPDPSTPTPPDSSSPAPTDG